MKFDLIFFFNNVGILRFPDEEVSLGTLTLSSTQRRENVIRQNNSLPIWQRLLRRRCRGRDYYDQ